MRISRWLCLLPGIVAFAHAQPATAEQDRLWRGQIRANFFMPDPLPALDAHTERRFDPAPGVTAEAVSYATEFGTRVPGILYLPKPLPPGGRIPGLVVINGHGGDKYSWYSFYTGILYARAGAAVLTYDQIGEGERNVDRKSGTRAHDHIVGGRELARSLCGLMITDAMQAVSYLAARPEVDPSRIGAGGYSLGSFVMALTGAVETRLHACVMVGGGNLDGPGGYWDSSGKPMCQAWPYQSLSFLGDRPAVIYALQAARGPALIWNGRADSVVGIPRDQEPFFEDLRARVISLRGAADDVFTFGFTSAGGHRPYFVTRPVALWLQKQLRFPNWTEASIAALPDVQIGGWARQHGVPIERIYATELREGGTMALDGDVPGYAREELSVFTPAQWEAVKGHYILESWLKAVLAAGHGR